MKTLFIIFISFFLGITKINDQEKIITKVIYEGYYEGTYTFKTIPENENELGEYIEFNEISLEILKKFYLKSEKQVNKKFVITYKEKTTIQDDEEIITYQLISIKYVDKV